MHPKWVMRSHFDSEWPQLNFEYNRQSTATPRRLCLIALRGLPPPKTDPNESILPHLPGVTDIRRFFNPPVNRSWSRFGIAASNRVRLSPFGNVCTVLDMVAGSQPASLRGRPRFSPILSGCLLAASPVTGRVELWKPSSCAPLAVDHRHVDRRK
jgi:hypothetical protein